MVNTGTWNSDLAYIFIGLFFLPLAIYMFMGCLIRAKELSERPYVINFYEEKEPRIIYRDVPRYYSRPAKKSKPRKSKPSPKPAPKPKVERKPKPSTNPNSSIYLDAISGLVGLGYKKSEARRLASSLSNEKSYKKAEDIITDVITKCV